MEKIIDLIATGQKANIELALQLVEGQGGKEKLKYLLYEKYKIFTKINYISLKVNTLYDFFNREIMDLSYLEISEIPDEIKDFKNVMWLYLDNNSFTEFPKGVLEMESLRLIDLSYNSLTEIPDEISKLQHLKNLDLTDNKIPISRLEEIEEKLPNSSVLFTY